MKETEVFEATMMRVEHKYPMTRKQYEAFLEKAGKHLLPDFYPEYDLHNIYYDTEDSAMIVHCLKDPHYKEKLRLRTYGEPNENTPCYLEIKRKCGSTGVKRRISLSENDARECVEHGAVIREDSQIAREISYLISRNRLKEKLFIAYHRTAFSGKEEKDLRITFDTDIRFRLDDLSLHETGGETYITEEDDVLMEIKVSGRYPLWLTEILSEMKLYRRSFSKYGVIYSALTKQAMDHERETDAAAVHQPMENTGKGNRLCSHQYSLLHS